MPVLSSPSIQFDLRLSIRNIIAISVWNEEEVGRRAYPYSTMAQRNPGGEHDLVLEDLPFIHLTISIGIREDHDASLRPQVIEVRASGLVVEILAEPDPASLVEGEGKGLLAIWFSRKGIHHEALGTFHLGDGLIRRKIFEGSLLRRLGMGEGQQEQADRQCLRY